MPLLQNRNLRIFLIAILVLLLVSVRAFESVLFYDPFYNYFQSDYLHGEFPKYDGVALFFGLTFRYLLNTAISLAIIQLIFLDRSLTKFAGLLYLFLFVFLIAVFFLIVRFSDSNNFVLFYVRRFLIQPILLLVFIPAFYFQKQQSKK